MPLEMISGEQTKETNEKPLAQDANSTQVIPFVTMCSSGQFHSVLLRSDGSAVACGRNEYGQCDIPPLEEGMCYTQVSAGGQVIQCFCEVMGVLLLAEGTHMDNATFRPLEEGVCYTQVSAGAAPFSASAN